MTEGFCEYTSKSYLASKFDLVTTDFDPITTEQESVNKPNGRTNERICAVVVRKSYCY